MSNKGCTVKETQTTAKNKKYAYSNPTIDSGSVSNFQQKIQISLVCTMILVRKKIITDSAKTSRVHISAAYKIMKNKFDSKISIIFYGKKKQIWWNHLIYSPRIQFWEEHYRRHGNTILKRARTSKTSMPFSRFCCNTMLIDLIVGVIRFVIITIDDIEGFLP